MVETIVLTVGSLTPDLTNQSINYDVSVSNPPAGPLTYSWDFGDGTSTSFSSNSAASHSYSAPGNYSVLVRMQHPGGEATKAVTQIIHNPLLSSEPSFASTIVSDDAAGEVWNVNPDNHSVTAVDSDTMAVLAEISTGANPRGVAFAPGSEVWVTNADFSTITVIDQSSKSVKRTISLQKGSSPFGIVFDGSNAYVGLKEAAQIIRIPSGARHPMLLYPSGLNLTVWL